MSSEKRSPVSARMLVESAIMVAIATILSLIKLVDLPYGGSVTIACMLPIILIAYRHGLRMGILAGLVFGLIQQLLGINTLSYVTSWQSVVAVILLDYLIAFMMAGFGGVFRRNKSQARALVLGSILVGVLRYACHVISGATVWAGLSIPTNAALLYSLGYNATYMIPETIVTAILASYIGSVLDFKSDRLTVLKRNEKASLASTRWWVALPIAVALIVDTVLVFSQLQNADSGEFDITGLANVSWTAVLIVSASAVVLALILLFLPARSSSEKGTLHEQ